MVMYVVLLTSYASLVLMGRHKKRRPSLLRSRLNPLLDLIGERVKREGVLDA